MCTGCSVKNSISDKLSSGTKAHDKFSIQTQNSAINLHVKYCELHHRTFKSSLNATTTIHYLSTMVTSEALDFCRG